MILTKHMGEVWVATNTTTGVAAIGKTEQDAIDAVQFIEERRLPLNKEDNEQNE